MGDKPFQRLGATSNAQVGASFEASAQQFFARKGLRLTANFVVPIGVHQQRKNRRFDLGCASPATIIECKSHKWTAGSNIPSAKMTVWNESMYYFHLAPSEFRKILFVLKDHHITRGLSLASHYIKNHGHLIPQSVELWEYDSESDDAHQVH